ncbi:hypothetical protein ABB02_00876 [Clostridiaceae bacterium JG1575]|nr:hypothetical protein ABB02_00876 [Clostridiaceae bacterium JG1575]
MNGIGRKIRAERLARGLSQRDLATLSRISNTYLSDIEVERTNPSLRTLEKIAKALDLDIKKLL